MCNPEKITVEVGSALTRARAADVRAYGGNFLKPAESSSSALSLSSAHPTRFLTRSSMVSSPSGPRTLVLGGTGQQGSSVISHLLSSDQPYNLVTITRDASKPAAQTLKSKGVEVLQGDTSKTEVLAEAVKGAKIVFGVTACKSLPCSHGSLRPTLTCNRLGARRRRTRAPRRPLVSSFLCGHRSTLPRRTPMASTPRLSSLIRSTRSRSTPARRG